MPLSSLPVLIDPIIVLRLLHHWILSQKIGHIHPPTRHYSHHLQQQQQQQVVAGTSAVITTPTAAHVAAPATSSAATKSCAKSAIGSTTTTTTTTTTATTATIGQTTTTALAFIRSKTAHHKRPIVRRELSLPADERVISRLEAQLLPHVIKQKSNSLTFKIENIICCLLLNRCVYNCIVSGGHFVRR